MKRKMWSKKLLNEWLAGLGLKPCNSFEAYGRKVCAYINAGSPVARERLEELLVTAGQTVNRGYWPGSSVVEMQVTYFKAWHWDE